MFCISAKERQVVMNPGGTSCYPVAGTLSGMEFS